MTAAQFSTQLAAWCAKYPNQPIAAAALGVSYGTLMGWLGSRMPCSLTRAAVLRRMDGGAEDPAEELNAIELAADAGGGAQCTDSRKGKPRACLISPAPRSGRLSR